MSEYTPSLERLRDTYADLGVSGNRVSQFEAEFDRAIAKACADAKAESTVGFVIVDIKTRKLDWDGEMHPTREVAIESLTGHTWWCRTPEEATDERTYYGDVYEILPVTQ